MEIFAVIFANNKLFKIKIDKIMLKMNYVTRRLGRLIILLIEKYILVKSK